MGQVSCAHGCCALVPAGHAGRGDPRPLEAALKELRHLCRERSLRTPGSRRHGETSRKITRRQRRVVGIRGHHVHHLTTRLAKTHGAIVVEGLDAAGMLRQKGLAGVRARRRAPRGR